MEAAKLSSKGGGSGQAASTYSSAKYGLDMAYPGAPSMRIVVDIIYVFWEIPTHSITLIGIQIVPT